MTALAINKKNRTMRILAHLGAGVVGAVFIR